jgi:hypothetical protein
MKLFSNINNVLNCFRKVAIVYIYLAVVLDYNVH